MSIGNFSPESGRITLEDGTYINVGDVTKAIFQGGTIVTKDIRTHKLDIGKHYTANYMYQNIPNNGFAYLQITTQENPAHIIYQVEGRGDAEVYSYPAAQTTGGTLVTSIPSNSQIIIPSTTIIRHTPTIVSTGVVYGPRLKSGGTGGLAIPTVLGNQEYVVGANKKVVLAVKNVSGQVWDRVDISLTWYE